MPELGGNAGQFIKIIRPHRAEGDPVDAGHLLRMRDQPVFQNAGRALVGNAQQPRQLVLFNAREGYPFL